MGLERWLSSREHTATFSENQVGFLVHMLGSSQPLIIPDPGDPEGTFPNIIKICVTNPQATLSYMEKI